MEHFDYYKIPSVEEANSVISEINRRLNLKEETFDIPKRHPIEDFCLIVRPEYNVNFDDLLQNYEPITRLEARRQGWYFGRFIGTFGREREKLEDINFLMDALNNNLGKPNFPLVRSITFSLLSGCYSMRDGIDKKIRKTKLKNTLLEWWLERCNEMDEKHSLLQTYQQYMNTEKHGGAIGNQHSDLELLPSASFNSLVVEKTGIDPSWINLEISAEGAFMTGNVGTPEERRYPVGIHQALYEINVINPPQKHLGQPIESPSFFSHMTMITKYYRKLLFDLEILVGDRK